MKNLNPNRRSNRSAIEILDAAIAARLRAWDKPDWCPVKAVHAADNHPRFEDGPSCAARRALWALRRVIGPHYYRGCQGREDDSPARWASRPEITNEEVMAALKAAVDLVQAPADTPVSRPWEGHCSISIETCYWRQCQLILSMHIWKESKEVKGYYNKKNLR